MQFNVSGQFLSFSLISAISGNLVVGIASGQISGWRSTDGASGIVLSGPVFETSSGHGLYKANLFDFDTSGKFIAYQFTCSGCIPQTFSVETDLLLSGRLYPASGGTIIASGPTVVVVVATISGNNSIVPIATLSGVVANSGLFVSVPLASISGVQPISGSFVSVPIASLSGVVANSGLFVTVPIASISGNNSIVPPANLSGLNANANVITWLGVAPNALISSGRLDAAFNVRTNVARSGTVGTIQLDAGVPTGISGVYDGSVITLVGGTGAGRSRMIVNMGSSGIAFISPNWDASGVPDATSIFTITPGAENFSGQMYIASGAFVNVPLASISGNNSVVPPANLSGVTVSIVLATLSGVQPISGTTVSVPIASISGAVANSGLFVSVPIASISGVNAVANANVASGSLFLASGSIFLNTFASGVVGGGSGNLPSSWGGSGAVTIGQNLASGTFASLGLASISGVNAVVPIATLSGLTANSGLNVTVPIATLSGIQPISGSFVSVPISSISGLTANSGLNVTVPVATLSGVQIQSGANVTVPIASISGVNVIAVATVNSGTLYLASGSVFLNTFASGVVGGGSGNLPSAWGNSGAVTVGQDLASGVFVTVPPATLSGLTANSGLFVSVPIATLSGVQPISGATVVVPLVTLSGVQPISGTTVSVPLVSISGVNAVVPIATLSGLTANSGLFVVVQSGTFVTVPPATLSGVSTTVLPANLSGVVVNSGLFVTVPIATLSGVQPISGTTVTVPIASISGLTAVVPIATVSGLNAVVPPANLSGVNAIIPPANLSGVFATVLPANLSGVNVNSGLNVILPLANLSGVNAVVPPANLSGVNATVPPANLSGVFASILSGSLYLASGVTPVNFPALVINTSGQVQLTPSQPMPTSGAANSVGDCLTAARAQGYGSWRIVGTTLNVYAPDNVTVLRAFTLDSATAPTSRS